MTSLEGRTLVNAVLGVVVAAAVYALGPLAVVAPMTGGFVAGFLQRRGGRGGTTAGFLTGLLASVPVAVVAAVLTNHFIDVPFVNAILLPHLVLGVAGIVLFSMASGLVGGLAGGLVRRLL